MFLIAFQKSNKIDLKELESSKNVLLTKKSLFKEEFKDKERIKKLLRQLLMRTRIKVSLKWEITFIFKTCGTNSWKRRWIMKWETQLLLMRLSKLLIPLLGAKMLQILLEDSWPENNNTVHFSLTLLRVKERLIISKKKTITWVKEFMTLELNLKLLKMMVSKMPKLNSKIKIS